MEDKLLILLIENNPKITQVISDGFAGIGTGFDLAWADCLSKGMEHTIATCFPTPLNRGLVLSILFLPARTSRCIFRDPEMIPEPLFSTIARCLSLSMRFCGGYS